MDTRLVELEHRLADIRTELQRAHQQVDARAEQILGQLNARAEQILAELDARSEQILARIATETELSSDTTKLFGSSFLELRRLVGRVLDEVGGTDGPTGEQASGGAGADTGPGVAGR